VKMPRTVSKGSFADSWRVSSILRQFVTGGIKKRLQFFVCSLHRVAAVCADEVKAVAKVNYSANHEWLGIGAVSRFLPCCALFRPIQGSVWVCLPEVDSRAEPIVRIFAGTKWFVQENPLTGLPVAAVVAKHEGGGEIMHPGDNVQSACRPGSRSQLELETPEPSAASQSPVLEFSSSLRASPANLCRSWAGFPSLRLWRFSCRIKVYRNDEIPAAPFAG